MVGDDFLHPTRQVQPSLLQETGQRLGVVEHVHPQFVLVAEGVHTVGRGRHHTCRADLLQQRFPFLQQHLKEAHLPHPAHLVAAAGLLCAQMPEVHPGGLEHSDQRFRRRLGADVVGGATAGEEERLAAFLGRFDLQPLHPGGPVFPRVAQRVTLAEDAHQRVANGAGHLPLLHQQTPQGDDDLRRADVLWTALHAGEAAGAVPEFLPMDRPGDVADQRAVDQGADVQHRCHRNGTPTGALPALDATEEVQAKSDFPCVLLDVHKH